MGDILLRFFSMLPSSFFLGVVALLYFIELGGLV
jgi:hypothetical protein